MNVRYSGGEHDTPERTKKIELLLPKQTIISTVLEPSIEKRLFGVIKKAK